MMEANTGYAIVVERGPPGPRSWFTGGPGGPRSTLRTVAWGDGEGAVLERVDLAHDNLQVGEAVMLLRRPGDGAVDARPALDLVHVGDDVVVLRPGRLECLGHHHGAVPAERDPPQQRVGELDLLLLQALDELGRARRQLAVLVAAVAEVVGVDLVPVLGLLEQGLGLTRAQRRLTDDRHVPVHGAARVQDARQEAGVDAPRHDGLGAGA